MNNNQQAFFALVEAGLWEQETQLSQYGKLDYEELMRLADEQSVNGLITAGLEHVSDVKVPKEELLQFIGSSLQIEQKNREMNLFIANIIEKLRKEDINVILVKGQGLAQCYEKPLWRACGDVDLLLSDSNYKKAKEYLCSLASHVEEEDTHVLHMGMDINSWIVEIHGSLRSCSLSRMDKVIDEAQKDAFYGGDVRSWIDGNTHVFLPGVNCDIIFVFTHIIKHFFRGGIGLRQICDWCRFLWKYREEIDVNLLEKRLKTMGIIAEWKSFAYLAVNTLGMPQQAMPFYEPTDYWKRKSERILRVILKTGSFGHNIDHSYLNQYGPIRRKLSVLWLGTSENLTHFRIFPLDSIRVWFNMLKKGVLYFVSGRR